MKCEYPSYRRAAQVIQCLERNVGQTNNAFKAWKHAIFWALIWIKKTALNGRRPTEGELHVRQPACAHLTARY
jgi:hypothetical protein